LSCSLLLQAHSPFNTVEPSQTGRRGIVSAAAFFVDEPNPTVLPAVAAREPTAFNPDNGLPPDAECRRAHESPLVRPRLLVIENAARVMSELLSEAARRRGAELTLNVARAIQEATDAVTRDAYDAAICWAERSDELEVVVRLRRSAPQLPILLLSPVNDSSFRRLALEKGVSTFLPATKEWTVVLETILHALRLEQATRQLRDRTCRAAELSQDVATLVGQNKALAEDTHLLLRTRAPAFLPLLVTDHPERAQLIRRAFDLAGAPQPLPAVGSSGAAIDYLSRNAPFGNGEEYPLPSLVLLDLRSSASGSQDGNGEAGLGLLRWIRQHSSYKHLPIIILGSSDRNQEVQEVAGSRSNTHVIATDSLSELVEMIRALHLYWPSLQIHRGR